jgi:hypothetical protein
LQIFRARGVVFTIDEYGSDEGRLQRECLILLDVIANCAALFVNRLNAWSDTDGQNSISYTGGEECCRQQRRDWGIG